MDDAAGADTRLTTASTRIDRAGAQRLRQELSHFGFDSVFRGYPDPTFAVDPTGTIIDCNPMLLAELRLDADDVIGTPYSSIVSDRDSVRAELELASATRGAPGRFTLELRRGDGTAFRAGVVLFPVLHDGVLLAVVGFARDIAELDSTVQLAERGQAMERMAGRLSLMGSWSIERDSWELTWSPELREMLGYDPSVQPELDAALDLHPEADRAKIESALQLCLTLGSPFDLLISIYTASRSLLKIRILGEAIRDATGEIVRAQGTVSDITDQIAAVAAQLNIEERLASMAEGISDGILILNADLSVRHINPRGEEIMQRPASEILGTDLWDVFPAWRGTEFSIAYRQAELAGTPVDVRAFYGPLELWLEVRMYPLTSGFAIYVHDATDEEAKRQKADEDRRRIIAQAALLDVARDAIVVRGLDNTIRYWNRAAAELYGWTSEEVIGLPIRELLYGNSEMFETATALTMRDGMWNGQTEQVTRSGESIIVESSWTLVSDEDGVPDSIFSVNSDVTQRRGEDERRLRAQRMESLGTLAGGVAHDLNNVLTPVLMSVQLLARGEKDPTRSELLSIMETSVKRGAEMIRQVLSFARGVEGRRLEVDLNELLVELESECNEALPAHVHLSLDASDGLWRTNGDPTQLLQVLINLVNNARDAMPDGGDLSITARNISVAESITSLTHVAAPGDYVVIEVRDDGTGMTAATIDRIFEPFFTTKGVGQGTGLGLATSAAILNSHGGIVQVHSALGIGTRFVVSLPASTEPVDLTIQLDGEIELEDLPDGNGQLVLVVDDESAIRHVARQTLEAFGYRTVVASNGTEAMEYCDAAPGTVSLVLTDMMMPVMDGAALASRLHVSHPEVRIVATSGLNTAGGVLRAADSGVHHFLPKPFTTGELLRVVHTALDDSENA